MLTSSTIFTKPIKLLNFLATNVKILVINNNNIGYLIFSVNNINSILKNKGNKNSIYILEYTYYFFLFPNNLGKFNSMWILRFKLNYIFYFHTE